MFGSTSPPPCSQLYYKLSTVPSLFSKSPSKYWQLKFLQESASTLLPLPRVLFFSALFHTFYPLARYMHLFPVSCDTRPKCTSWVSGCVTHWLSTGSSPECRCHNHSLQSRCRYWKSSLDPPRAQLPAQCKTQVSNSSVHCTSLFMLWHLLGAGLHKGEKRRRYIWMRPYLS